MIFNWLLQIKKLITAKKDFVIISVISTKGSAPSTIGDKMICMNNNIIYGTIGGGNLEYKAVQYAANLNKQMITKTYSLGAKLGQCCGGIVTLMFENFTYLSCLVWMNEVLKQIEKKNNFVLTTIINSTSNKYTIGDKNVYLDDYRDDIIGQYTSDLLQNTQHSKHTEQIYLHDNTTIDVYCEPYILNSLLPVVIFGAGHITNALIPIIVNLPIQIYLIDDRANELAKYYKYDVIKIIEDTNIIDEEIPNNAYYLIMSYSHKLDFDMCLNILKLNQFSYLGLIGSKTKTAKFKARLRARQIDENLLDKIISPIGKKYMSVQSPNAIAISLATSILDFLEEKNYK